METETKIESPAEDVLNKNTPKNNLSIPAAIIIVGLLIAGAIYFSSTSKNISPNNNKIAVTTLSPIGDSDRTLGNLNAKVALILYEDFQCPFCGAVSGLNTPLIQSLKQRDSSWTPFVSEVINNYVKNGKVLLVYRDWAFLGTESIRAAEAARCAQDQNKFWEYHDYLYSHQNGENEGNFSDIKLKSFAKSLNLDTATFNQCFDENKYAQAIIDSKNEGIKAGVEGTPKGFIVKNGEIYDTIDGAESFKTVQQKIDSALK